MPYCPPKLLGRVGKKVSRIAICKDVLRNLRARRLSLGYGYILGFPKGYSDWDQIPQSVDAREKLGNCYEGCSVCALGSMMLSHVGLFDKVGLKKLIGAGSGTVYERLGEYFSSEQLRAIEHAYMLWDGDSDEDSKLVVAACEFGKKYKDEHKRLRAIMLNVIKNDGEFKP